MLSSPEQRPSLLPAHGTRRVVTLPRQLVTGRGPIPQSAALRFQLRRQEPGVAALPQQRQNAIRDPAGGHRETIERPHRRQDVTDTIVAALAAIAAALTLDRGHLQRSDQQIDWKRTRLNCS